MLALALTSCTLLSHGTWHSILAHARAGTFGGLTSGYGLLPVSALKRPTPGQAADAYLGLLYPTEDYKIYGCLPTAASYLCRPLPLWPESRWLYGSRQLKSKRLCRYITNTKVKLVLVIAINTTNFKDDDLIAVRQLVVGWSQAGWLHWLGTYPATSAAYARANDTQQHQGSHSRPTRRICMLKLPNASI